MITIAGRDIDSDQPPYIVAELSGNHGGDIEQALALIEAAADSGVDAVKFQTYTPDTISLDCDREEFLVSNPLWRGKTLYQLYDEAHTPYEWHAALFEKARSLGITPLSSPFDDSAVDLLESLDVAAYKIASSELVDVNLIRRVAATGKPVILSTGMASFAEIEEAINTVRQTGNDQICLLHCVAAYPTPPEQAHLNTLAALQRFGCELGLSDHSPGTMVAEAAVAMGAVLIEKHLCLSREMKTVDSDFSLEPRELRALVHRCQAVFSLKGQVLDGAAAAEAEGRTYRRSLYAVKDIDIGEVFTEQNIRSIRPANGLHPRYLQQLIGTTSKRKLPRGTPLASEDLP